MCFDTLFGARYSAILWLPPLSLGVRVPKSILLVDDSTVVRSATRHYLESIPGLEVCGEAVNGLDAVELAHDLNPDLIILDLAMPRMDGLQTARELRAARFTAPIILFTMYADAVRPSDMRAAGITVVVSKEDPKALPSQIQNIFAAA
jgi:DNA-binding NarL/FixJ family response regulator